MIIHKQETRAVKDLLPYAKNARTHSKEQVAQIVKSIREFGFTNPILIKPDNTIIAGHGRVMALNKMGEKDAPVVVVDGLTDAQIQALIIADNKIALNSGWDIEILTAELNEIKLNFSDDFMVDLGLDFPDLDLGMNDNPEPEGDPDDVPEPPAEPKSKLGDIWILGNHRLMCGDSTDAGSVALLMDGNKADMVFTDPPYLIETQGGCKGKIGNALRKQSSAIEFISNFEPAEFLKILLLVFNPTKFNAYIFCNKDLLPDYLLWAKDNKISFNVLIWKKPNAIPIGDSHRPDIEYLLLFRKSAIWNNGIKDVNYSRCLEYGREKGLHPTMKPVELIENEIYISSNTKSIILDLFLGSGSTLIACEKTNRICFGMEIDPTYCDVIIARWQKFTGKQAIRADGVKFDEL